MDSPPEPFTRLPDIPLQSEIPQVNLEPVQRPSVGRQIFFGADGLRAGWSLLIYLALVLVAVLGVHFGTRAIRAHMGAPASAPMSATVQGGQASAAKPAETTTGRVEPVGPMILVEVIILTAIFLISLLMAAIEHRRVSVFGLGGEHPIRKLFAGSMTGFAAMSLVIAIFITFHLLRFDTRLLQGSAILKWAAAQLFAFLCVGLVEEYAFRGYLQYTLTRGFLGLGNRISRSHGNAIAFSMAAFLTSVLFFMAHIGNDGETRLGLLQIVLFGILLVLALWRTGSLWWAIGFHMAWDWAQSFLYGVPDSGGFTQGRLWETHALGNPLLSGGTAGPEGSVLVIPVLLLVVLVLFLTQRSSPPQLR